MLPLNMLHCGMLSLVRSNQSVDRSVGKRFLPRRILNLIEGITRRSTTISREIRIYTTDVRRNYTGFTPIEGVSVS